MPTTGRFNTAQLNTVYITSDGTSGGTPCKLTVPGLDALANTFTGNVVTALDGTPYIQKKSRTGAGLPVSVKIETVSTDLFALLRNEINDAVTDEDDLNLIISGDTGDFNLTVKPLFPTPVQFSGDFVLGMIKEVTLNFIVVVRSYQLTASPGAFALSGQAATLTVS